MKHRIKELLVAIPIDTKEAKRMLLDATKIKYDRFYRMLNNPKHRISTSDAILIADFFSIETKDLFHNENDIKLVVKEIMENSEPIKSLIDYDEQKMVRSSNFDGQKGRSDAAERNLSSCNS